MSPSAKRKEIRNSRAISRILVVGLVLAVGLLIVASKPSSATTIALWNYNSQPADNEGAVTGAQNPAADIGFGSQSLFGTPIYGYDDGGYPKSGAGDYSSDPAVGKTDVRYRILAYEYQGITWNVSTLGYKDVKVQLGFFSPSDLTGRTFSFGYSLDGLVTGISLGSYPYSGNSSWSTFSFDLTGIEGVDNNPNFIFGFMSDQSKQTLGIDYVLITGTPVPIPGAFWLLGSGLVGLVAIRRRLQK